MSVLSCSCATSLEESSCSLHRAECGCHFTPPTWSDSQNLRLEIPNLTSCGSRCLGPGRPMVLETGVLWGRRAAETSMLFWEPSSRALLCDGHLVESSGPWCGTAPEHPIMRSVSSGNFPVFTRNRRLRKRVATIRKESLLLSFAVLGIGGGWVGASFRLWNLW